MAGHHRVSGRCGPRRGRGRARAPRRRRRRADDACLPAARACNRNRVARQPEGGAAGAGGGGSSVGKSGNGRARAPPPVAALPLSRAHAAAPQARRCRPRRSLDRPSVALSYARLPCQREWSHRGAPHPNRPRSARRPPSRVPVLTGRTLPCISCQRSAAASGRACAARAPPRANVPAADRCSARAGVAPRRAAARATRGAAAAPP